VGRPQGGHHDRHLLVALRAEETARRAVRPWHPWPTTLILTRTGSSGRLELNGDTVMELDGLEVLSERQCRWLLGQERVGRVAVSDGALATVFPVNYSVVSDEILFFTGEGTKLRAATLNARITFQVDHIDPFAQAGWSVLVVGLAREVTEPVVVAGARASGLRPWAKGDRARLVALTTELVSGRRIGDKVDLREPGPIAGLAMIGPQSPVSALARPPVRVGAGWSLQAAAHAMREANVSSVLVDPDTAIVTERDLTQALSAGTQTPPSRQ
jgi:uncharacterized protein